MISTQSEIYSCLLPRAKLTSQQRTKMFQLLSGHFEGVSRAQFDQDLQEKNWIILLQRDDRLVGFSTLLAYETLIGQEPVSVVYSGDTIVAREAWGSMALAQTWIASVNQLRTQFPRGRYYWLLLTSGFRTYRFLPLFWREFYPRFNAHTPDPIQCLLDRLAVERLGSQYDSMAGIVRFNHPQRLRNGLADVPDGRKANPHVAYFLTRNPGHGLGDELVCLTELHENNLTSAGKRMVLARKHDSISSHC
jgi:hypothetical protein